MKYIRLPLVLIVIFFVTILGISTVHADAEGDRKANPADKEKIQEVINKYFDLRYQSRAKNQVADLHEVIDGSAQASYFNNSEIEKLEVEVHNAKLHDLGFVQYKYILNYKSITFEKDNLSAAVSLIEGHDVIFEISAMVSKTDPVVSKMYGLEHTIILRKSQTGWKIVSDQYNDYLWRMIRATNISKDALLQSIDNNASNRPSSITEMQTFMFSCDLQADISIHPYDRYGAVAYARKYALNPNPNYYFFAGADCTNFVNQAIHHSSNAEEVGNDSYGWYYNSGLDHSASWTDVGQLYNIITDYHAWNKGPEGCLTDRNDAMPGDLVQFEWFEDLNGDGIDDDIIWDHSVIIVIKGSGGSGYQYWVSGHTDNIDAYPLESITYASRRFLHIERIDGYANLHIPMVLNQNSGSLKSTTPDPYPAPMETGGFLQLQATPSPYPAPGH